MAHDLTEPLVDHHGELSHADLLRRAAEQARERGLHDVFIVDADFHQSEAGSWREILGYLENDVVRDFLTKAGRGEWWVPGEVTAGGLQEVAGRIRPTGAWEEAHPDKSGAERDIARVRETMDAMGSDFVSLFPTSFLDLGTNPRSEFETHLAFAYARWMVERVLPAEPRIIAMLFLPFGDPDASLRLVREFGDQPGVVGFMISTTRFSPVHDRRYAPLYRELEDRGLALGFHSSFNFYDRTTEQLNKFISVHSLGFPYYAMVQMTNWIVNGLPERFPRLKVLWIEAGLAWVPFLMQRLDNEFLMRPSEAPLLQRRPSEYMREFFYTSQPLETQHPEMLALTLEMIDAGNQLLWASDWPHWDWDPPAKIWDLPQLGEAAKRQILGGNAQRLFGARLPARSGKE